MNLVLFKATLGEKKERKDTITDGVLSRCAVPGGCQLGLRHPCPGMCAGSTHFRFSCVLYPRCEHINWNV